MIGISWNSSNNKEQQGMIRNTRTQNNKNNKEYQGIVGIAWNDMNNHRKQQENKTY